VPPKHPAFPPELDSGRGRFALLRRTLATVCPWPRGAWSFRAEVLYSRQHTPERGAGGYSAFATSGAGLRVRTLCMAATYPRRSPSMPRSDPARLRHGLGAVPRSWNGPPGNTKRGPCADNICVALRPSATRLVFWESFTANSMPENS